jgi:hypothetical protein
MITPCALRLRYRTAKLNALMWLLGRLRAGAVSVAQKAPGLGGQSQTRGQLTVEGGLTAISYAKTARPKPRRKLRKIITRLS